MSSNQVLYHFRPLRPSDRREIQWLHEQWFPVRYGNEFFDAIVYHRLNVPRSQRDKSEESKEEKKTEEDSQQECHDQNKPNDQDQFRDITEDQYFNAMDDEERQLNYCSLDSDNKLNNHDGIKSVHINTLIKEGSKHDWKKYDAAATHIGKRKTSKVSMPVLSPPSPLPSLSTGSTTSTSSCIQSNSVCNDPDNEQRTTAMIVSEDEVGDKCTNNNIGSPSSPSSSLSDSVRGDDIIVSEENQFERKEQTMDECSCDGTEMAVLAPIDDSAPMTTIIRRSPSPPYIPRQVVPQSLPQETHIPSDNLPLPDFNQSNKLSEVEMKRRARYSYLSPRQQPGLCLAAGQAKIMMDNKGFSTLTSSQSNETKTGSCSSNNRGRSEKKIFSCVATTRTSQSLQTSSLKSFNTKSHGGDVPVDMDNNNEESVIAGCVICCMNSIDMFRPKVRRRKKASNDSIRNNDEESEEDPFHSPMLGRQLVEDWSRHTELCYIMTLGVRDEYRSMGLGSTLIKRAIQYASSQKSCGVIYLHVITYNHAAIQCYERLGFVFVEELINYYTINQVHYNCYLYAKYLNGNHQRKYQRQLTVSQWKTFVKDYCGALLKRSKTCISQCMGMPLRNILQSVKSFLAVSSQRTQSFRRRSKTSIENDIASAGRMREAATIAAAAAAASSGLSPSALRHGSNVGFQKRQRQRVRWSIDDCNSGKRDIQISSYESNKTGASDDGALIEESRNPHAKINSLRSSLL